MSLRTYQRILKVPVLSFLLTEKMSAIARSSALLAPKLLKTAPVVGAQTRF